MNASGLPTGLVVALSAGVLLVAIVICGIAMTRTSFARRAAFARFLSHAFLVVLVFALIVGMIVQARG